ncbi:MMPL family transporter [Massilia forsythiae]|uniref:MMPL family transporter n=2 Tax=Massilia forsythiae TaxID=2728020 RepID=A0A7Z2W1J1_9BURK|nr:MMPL family transporter [Massilia forsythiae]
MATSLIEVRPVLDFSELMPGAPSSRAIRAAARELHLAERYHASVALTGPIPLADDEFASLQEGSALTAVAPVALLVCILWRALRSWRLVLAVLLTMLGGLVITAALGVLMVGELNVISIAFAILFVGIGVDFGIQFGMRFRELRRRHGGAGTGAALHDAARAIALPLALAAAATACGFLAFLPTAYRGVAELGQIAGVGILFVAFPSCVTVLPALICLMPPPPSAVAPGYPRLAPLDRALQAHRRTVLGATLALVAAGLPLLWQLRFDADPLHLKDPASESMATLRALEGGAGNGASVGIDNIQVLAASPAAAQALARRLARLPEVGSATSVADLVPDRQDDKLRAIGTAAAALLPALAQAPLPAASDAQRVTALRAAAQALRNAALDHPGPGAAQAVRLAAALAALARAGPALRDRAEHALAMPLRLALETLELALQAGPVTLAGLPQALRRNWIAPDGRALVDVGPRPAREPTRARRNARDGATARTDRAPGDGGAGSSASDDGGVSHGGGKHGSDREPGNASEHGDARLRAFARAVLREAPEASGGTVSVQGAAQLIVDAFIEAALLAVLAITLLLWLAFRRFGDVLRTMVPLLVSGLVTLEACVLLGIDLNFANIIALPLLLGVGVAFKIYYVMAWRSGEAALLQHALTQAIVLSAATTATAFGSLWLSHHPGTASMGELLVLALVCTLVGAVFFQPVLLGRPRQAQADRPGRDGPAHD